MVSFCVILGSFLEIIRAIFRPDVIAPIMIFSIPISAILGSFYYKLQKLKIQNRVGLAPEDLDLLRQSLAESKNMNERVKNLETIITSLDKEILALKAEDDAQRVKTLAEKVKE
ncbi:MAG: hypothetical protein EAZ85_11710 [Bacteroidetes bacterium]|nr:MAG: hypothetical protein EAZ85_11710 [Bacteroidota bacterium]TAG87438.1 MAG: hypothetical protein EAZ20_10615 [Bacteroidota bacterium]